jgi:acetyltransferase-like isoleucine patch superfamily enzyme
MTGVIIGSNWGEVEKSKEFFLERYCFIDCRGRFVVARSSIWGFNITVLTASHNISTGRVEEVTLKEVIVDAHAWIASNAVLYNCTIGQGAIVSVGSVVSNMTVLPYTMVEGNPARVIKKFDGQKWERVDVGFNNQHRQ